MGKAHHGKVEITIGDDENDYKGVSSQDFYFVVSRFSLVKKKQIIMMVFRNVTVLDKQLRTRRSLIN